MSDRIFIRVGEALVAGGPPGNAAEPELSLENWMGHLVQLLRTCLVIRSRVIHVYWPF